MNSSRPFLAFLLAAAFALAFAVAARAADEAAAVAFMNGDPAVSGSIMTAELRPYAVALQRAR